jgi:3-deoxy-D-manno-octulosonic-acid transferase
MLLGLTGPVLLLAGKRRAGIWQKLGFIPESVKRRSGKAKRTVWFHSVSVGEFNAVWPLIQSFSNQHPDYSIIISTATQTGQNLAKAKAGDKATVIYFPLDLPWSINQWLNELKPNLVAIVETEIWPGFTFECFRRSIPVVVVNGRISPRSAAGYHRWRAFFGPVVRQFRAIVAQSEADADRYRLIAGEQLPLTVSGNLKLDGLAPAAPEVTASLREALKLNSEQQVLIAGSTHEGEEQAMLQVLSMLKQEHRNARLILAPRHPERWNHVASLIESSGFRVRRYSRKESFEADDDVYLLDTIGQLFNYYSLASVAFVGGTLVPVGGHNIVEPYAYAVPVVCGANLDKTRDSANGLKGAGALTVVNNASELAASILALLQSDSLRRRHGEAGRTWLQVSQGAVAKTLSVVEAVLQETYNDPHPGSGQQQGVLSK